MLSLLVASSLALALDPPALDPAPWQAVLTAHVDAAGRVDYAAVKASGALDGYLQAVAAAPLPQDKAQRIALWINAYNALTVDLVADNWPLGSIMELDGGKVWDTRRFVVAGESLTLNELEHKRLRPITDGRIHAALNCASKGCPALPRTAFDAATLDTQLSHAARAWASSNALVIDKTQGSVQVSRIFEWFAEDFTSGPHPAGTEGALGSALAWIASYSNAEQAEYLRAGGFGTGWAEYDWKVNGR